MEIIADPPNIEPAVENNPKHEDLRKKAEMWIAENPRGYSVFLSKARIHVELGLRFSAKSLAEEVRLAGRLYGDQAEDDYLIDNDLVAYISRRLVQDVPEAARYLKFRQTRW